MSRRKVSLFFLKPLPFFFPQIHPRYLPLGFPFSCLVSHQANFPETFFPLFITFLHFVKNKALLRRIAVEKFIYEVKSMFFRTLTVHVKFSRQTSRSVCIVSPSTRCHVYLLSFANNRGGKRGLCSNFVPQENKYFFRKIN